MKHRSEYLIEHIEKRVKEKVPDYVIKAVTDTINHVYGIGFCWANCIDEYIRRRDK